MKILVTCPPMLKTKEHFIPILEQNGYEAVCPDFDQVMKEKDIIKILPECEGWIIGDDPATRKVFEAGKKGKFRAAVKWGIGIDNIDFNACDELGIPITNTPNMFGKEVADVALGYIIALARETFYIDRQIRNFKWPKNTGISLEDKTVALVGYGDIGMNLSIRLKALDMNIQIYDPGIKLPTTDKQIIHKEWPDNIEKCDFIVFTCALNKHNKHMLNEKILKICKNDVRIINVARGPLINEDDLSIALKKGNVHSVALDVFESEPLPNESYLRKHPLCILGSHNSSNTIEAVKKTNINALNKLFSFLEKS